MFFAVALLCISACSNTNELLESELRTREFQHRELVDEMHRIRHENLALQHEVLSLRQTQVLAPEVAGPMFGLKRITIGRLTGGRDIDQVIGDDSLYLVVEPRDGHDHLIKVPGTLQVAVLQVTNQGIKTPLCSWEITPGDLAASWQQTIFTNGYALDLPWTTWPSCENLRVVTRLIVTDGRVFEADRDIRVVLSPFAGQRPPAVPTDEPPPLDEALPAPLPLDKTPTSSVSGRLGLRQPVPLQETEN